MRCLLDTHVFLWRLLDPGRLSDAQAEALDNLDNDLLVSPISIWETLVLARKGRLHLQPDAESFVRRALVESPTIMAPFNFEIAITSEGLEGFENPDPADRFLVATSMVEGLCLITSDERILIYDKVETLA